MISWNKYFDHIYCIHFLPKHEQRFKRIQNELKRIGILNTDIFSWKFTTDIPFYSIIQKYSNHRHNQVKNEIGMFACAMAHYEIYKEAFYLNYNRILVLEEDVIFLKDINLIEKLLDHMPKTDVILFDKFCFNKYIYINHLQNAYYNYNEYYKLFDKNCIAYCSGACYSLNKLAYSTFIKQQEKCFYNPDEIWNNYNDNVEANKLTKSFVIQNLCYQKQFKDSLHGENQFSNLNVYKNVNLNEQLYN